MALLHFKISIMSLHGSLSPSLSQESSLFDIRGKSLALQRRQNEVLELQRKIVDVELEVATKKEEVRSILEEAKYLRSRAAGFEAESADVQVMIESQNASNRQLSEELQRLQEEHADIMHDMNRLKEDFEKECNDIMLDLRYVGSLTL